MGKGEILRCSRCVGRFTRMFHEMDLPDMQGAECKAVLVYRALFCNAADPVKAFRPKGDNLRQRNHF